MTAESGSNDRGLRELAQRLLTHAHPEGPTSVEVLLRRLPESVALEIPMPPGSLLLGSVLHSRQGRPTLMEAVFDSEREPHEVVTAYAPELAQRGWNAFEGFGGMQGGFVPGGMGEGRSFRRDNGGPVLMVVGRAGIGKPTDLRLRLDWEIIRHLPEMRRHGRPEGAERLPTLGPPSGILLRGGGSGGGGGTWHSEASVETDLPVAELQSHFALQLERADWKRVGGSADDTVGWSSWQLPGEGNWTGILLVLATRPHERFLYVRIEASVPSEGGYHVGGMTFTGG